MALLTNPRPTYYMKPYQRNDAAHNQVILHKFDVFEQGRDGHRFMFAMSTRWGCERANLLNEIHKRGIPLEDAQKLAKEMLLTDKVMRDENIFVRKSSRGYWNADKEAWYSSIAYATRYPRWRTEVITTVGPGEWHKVQPGE